MLPKVTSIELAAVVLGAVFAYDTLRKQRLRLPNSWTMGAVYVFAAGLVITTLTSTERSTSLIGWYGRYTGLIPYCAYLILFFAVVARADSAFWRQLRLTVLVCLGVVVAYGLLQAAGSDPLPWVENGLGGEFSTFGNVDFGAAWAAAALSVAVVTAVSAQDGPWWRSYAALLIPATALYLLATGTSQGMVVAVASCGWAGAVVVMSGDGTRRPVTPVRRRIAAAVLAGAVLLAVVAAVRLMPMLQSQLDQALVARPDYWITALRIFGQHPMLGTGLDTFGTHFSAFRPVSHAVASPSYRADAPHSVPLAMLANGGVALTIGYLLVTVLVGAALMRGVLRGTPEQRRVLAAFGGVWLGYQAQSLVSYDVPPLAVLNWVSSAVIVSVVAPPRWRNVRLFGGGERLSRLPASSRNARRSPFLKGAVVVAALVMGWLVLLPLRADLAASSAAPLMRQGEPGEAVDQLERAASLNPSEASYPFLAARVQEATGQLGGAYRSAVEAARRDPGGAQYALFAAQAAYVAGDFDAASKWFREAASRDPKNPVVLTAAAQYFIDRERPDVARDYVRAALAIDPDNSTATEQLAAMQSQRASG